MLRDKFRVMKNKFKMDKTAKTATILVVIFAVLFFAGFNTFASPNYELPEYIRVGLINNFQAKSQISTSTKSLVFGYESDDYEKPGDEYFNEVGTFDCTSGFYFVVNDSNRFTSDLYDDYDELLDDIDDSNDYIPLLEGEGKYRIITKAGRGASDLCPNSYSNLKSIVMVSGDNKEALVFEGDYPLFGSNESGDPKLMKISTSTANKSYRGWIKFIYESGKVSAISHVKFEEYLYGVITSEMPSDWNSEALKAQALCARNYSILRIKTRKGTYAYYDLVDSTLDQVYGGYSNEATSGRRAVDETAGEVIVYVGSNASYKDKLIDAYFSSCNGGAIEASENVWSAALPYCRAKKDPYEKENKHYGWTSKFTLSDATNAAARYAKAYGAVNPGNVTSITIEETEVGRAGYLNLKGDKGTLRIHGDNIRTFFNYLPQSIKSCNFELYSGNQAAQTETIKIPKEVSVIGSKGTVTRLVRDLNLFGTDSKLTSGSYTVISKDNFKSFIPLEETKVVEKESGNSAYDLKKGEYLVVGKGYGHGLGMSQYGANDMAKEGFTYDEIIKFYYTDVDIIHIN